MHRKEQKVAVGHCSVNFLGISVCSLQKRATSGGPGRASARREEGGRLYCHSRKASGGLALGVNGVHRLFQATFMAAWHEVLYQCFII